jgi:hypothetical protein
MIPSYIETACNSKLQQGKDRMRLFRPVLLSFLIISFSCILITCSRSTTDPQGPMEITFSPDIGPPGTIITILGIDPGRVDTDSLTVYIGGERSPIVFDISGSAYAGIPLFLDGTGGFDLPVAPVDIEIFEESSLIFETPGAITVTELPHAPGTTGELVTSMNNIAVSLSEIAAAMITLPGIQEQYALSLMEAVDSLLTGDSEHSLATAYTDLQGDATSMQVLDDVFANAGILETMNQYASLLESISMELQAGPPQAFRAPGAYTSTDVSLAKQMQFYVILSDFADEVVAASATQIGVVAGLVSLSSSHRYITIVSIITNYVNFLVNKYAVGLFPADLTSIDLDLADPTLENDVTTNSTIVLHAENRPPGITVLDLTEQLLVVLGLTGSPTDIQTFKTILLDAFSYFLGLMSSTIQAYSQAHPELDLDPTLFSLIPQMTFQAVATDPVLIDCETFTPQIVTPLTDQLEWQTSNTNKGEGRIYVRPSTSTDAHYFKSLFGYQYSAGAFGENMTQSPTVSVHVGDALALDVDFPMSIAPLGTETLEIRAGYHQPDGTITYSSNIGIAIAVTGGTADTPQGYTDSNGYFVTSVRNTDHTIDEMVIFVAAAGQDDTYAEKIVRSTINGVCRAIDLQTSAYFDLNIYFNIVLTCDPLQQRSWFNMIPLNSWAAGNVFYLGIVDGTTFNGTHGIPQGFVGDLIIEIWAWGEYDAPSCPGAINSTQIRDTVIVNIPGP